MNFLLVETFEVGSSAIGVEHSDRCESYPSKCVFQWRKQQSHCDKSGLHGGYSRISQQIFSGFSTAMPAVCDLALSWRRRTFPTKAPRLLFMRTAFFVAFNGWEQQAGLTVHRLCKISISKALFQSKNTVASALPAEKRVWAEFFPLSLFPFLILDYIDAPTFHYMSRYTSKE